MTMYGLCSFFIVHRAALSLFTVRWRVHDKNVHHTLSRKMDFTMILSAETRNITALILFVIFDHLIWYYCGIFEHVSIFYVVASEAVRIIALYGIVSVFYTKKHIHIVVLIIVVYCFLMLPFISFAGRSHYYADNSLIDNVLYIRKDTAIAIDSPFIAFFWYIYFMMSMYYFAWRHLDKIQNIK